MENVPSPPNHQKLRPLLMERQQLRQQQQYTPRQFQHIILKQFLQQRHIIHQQPLQQHIIRIVLGIILISLLMSMLAPFDILISLSFTYPI